MTILYYPVSPCHHDVLLQCCSVIISPSFLVCLSVSFCLGPPPPPLSSVFLFSLLNRYADDPTEQQDAGRIIAALSPVLSQNAVLRNLQDAVQASLDASMQVRI